MGGDISSAVTRPVQKDAVDRRPIVKALERRLTMSLSVAEIPDF